MHPSDWSDSARSTVEAYRATYADDELTLHHQALLDGLAALETLADRLEASITEHGTYVVGSQGQLVLNPAIPAYQKARQDMARITAELAAGLDVAADDDEDGYDRPMTASEAGRLGNRKRWGMRGYGA